MPTSHRQMLLERCIETCSYDFRHAGILAQAGFGKNRKEQCNQAGKERSEAFTSRKKATSSPENRGAALTEKTENHGKRTSTLHKRLISI